MNLNQDNKILASDFVSFKAEVKAECLRRKYTGSIAAYGGTSWDFVITPEQSHLIQKDQYDKIVTPLRQISTNNAPEKSVNSLIESLSALYANLQTYKSRTFTSSTTDCSSSCTGLCRTACSGSCTGCGGCDYICSTTCGYDGCTGCTGSCTGSCRGCTGCTDACTGNCGTNCVCSGAIGNG